MTDLFGNEETPIRPRSGREKENDAKIAYRKYHSAKGVPCYDCTQTKAGVRTATTVRKHGDAETYLCNGHAQERRDRERLG